MLNRSSKKKLRNSATIKKLPYKIGASEGQNNALHYAYEISGDKNFVYLLVAENGVIGHDTQSKRIGKNGYYDYGFCQINKGYHPHIVNDSRFLTDWQWQMQKCLELYRGGTVFYGKGRIPEVIDDIEWR